MAKNNSVLYPANLAAALSEYPAGSWVAISQPDQRIVGSGSTAAKAERQAQGAGHKPSLLLQVPANGFTAKRKNGNGVHEDKNATPLNLPSFYRGIYKRVARKLGCDPSYVSRVARGERASETVSQALKAELSHAVLLTGKSNSRSRRPYA